jgi:hypothetical protein
MKRANLFILQAAQGKIKRTPRRAHVEMFGKHTQRFGRVQTQRKMVNFPGWKQNQMNRANTLRPSSNSALRNERGVIRSSAHPVPKNLRSAQNHNAHHAQPRTAFAAYFALRDDGGCTL